MSEWITHRRPTKEDDGTRVWTMHKDKVVHEEFFRVELGRPWMPMIPPEPYVKPNEPYVKPKRCTVRYHGFETGVTCWVIDVIDYRYAFLVVLFGLHRNDDEHRQAAQEIANIYERTLP